MSDPASVEIVPVVRPSALVGLAAGIPDIVAAQASYQEICKALLDASDFAEVAGRAYKKKSAWRKLAVAFGVNLELVSITHERDEDGNIVRSEAIARAIAPNGRYADGYGACSLGERNMLHPSHEIPATAATRATNRAAADLFGMGEVSAEEVERGSTYSDAGEIPPHRSRRSGGSPDELRGISDVVARTLKTKLETAGLETLALQLQFVEEVLGRRVNRLNLLSTADYNAIVGALDEHVRAARAAARAAAEEQNDSEPALGEES